MSNVSSRKALIAMLSRFMETKRSRENQSRVDVRFVLRKCLNKFAVEPGSKEMIDCESLADGQRGLCKRCTAEFYREVQRGSSEEQAEYERRMIEEGLILASGEMREKKRTSGFFIKRKRTAS